MKYLVPGIIVAEPPGDNHIVLPHKYTSKRAIDMNIPSPMLGKRIAKNPVAANRPEQRRRLSLGPLRPGRSQGLSPCRLDPWISPAKHFVHAFLSSRTCCVLRLADKIYRGTRRQREIALHSFAHVLRPVQAKIAHIRRAHDVLCQA